MVEVMRRILMFSSSGEHTINEQVLARHSRYADALNDFPSEQYELLMAIPSNQLPGTYLHTQKHFSVISSGPKGHFGVRNDGLKTLSERFDDSHLLIASDPFLALRSAIKFRTMSKRNIPIETQFHGDFGNRKWRKSSIKSRVGGVLAEFQISKSNFFRVVSSTQMNGIVDLYKINPNRAYVAAVPIDPLDIDDSSISRTRSVLFVGRLHAERGLALWARVALWLHKQDPTISFTICGSGSQEKEFRTLLKPIRSENIRFLGHLPTAQLYSEMKLGGVLLSTPPFESFGRSLVEAYGSGLSTVATPTSGAIDLEKHFSGIKLSGFLPAELGRDVLKVLDAPSAHIDLNQRRVELEDYNRRNILILTHNWKKEIETFIT